MKRTLLLPPWVAVFLLAAGLQGAAPDKPAPLPEGVRTGSFQGWDKSLYLEARDPDALAVIVPAVGGRIMHYGLHSQNILFELPGVRGKTLATDRDLPWVGGYQCGVGPMEGPSVNQDAVSGPQTWSAPRELTVRLTAPADPATGIEVSKEILMDPENGDLGLDHRLKNSGAQVYTGQFWTRTLCGSGGYLVAHIRKSRRLPAGWALGKPGSPEMETARPQSENVSVRKGILVARGLGPSTRLSLETDADWIAYVLGRVLFIQYFPASTSDRSTPAPAKEVYFDLAAVDIRLSSAEFTIPPGGELGIPSKWALEGLDKEVTTHEQARSLANRIPPSPFQR